MGIGLMKHKKLVIWNKYQEAKMYLRETRRDLKSILYELEQRLRELDEINPEDMTLLSQDDSLMKDEKQQV